jgi:hypothetical protein
MYEFNRMMRPLFVDNSAIVLNKGRGTQGIKRPL